jgi:hypothetical protein
MSESVTKPPFTTSEELMAEEARLKALLKEKRSQIKADVLSLKEEFRPVIAVANVIGKLVSADQTRNKVAHAGANATIDIIARKIFPHGNFFTNFLLPKLVKNYTSSYVDKVAEKAAPALRKFGTRLTESVKHDGKKED